MRGSSTAGVAFTLKLYGDAATAESEARGQPAGSAVRIGDAVVEEAGNPAGVSGGAPGRLSHAALGRIGRCLTHP